MSLPYSKAHIVINPVVGRDIWVDGELDGPPLYSHHHAQALESCFLKTVEHFIAPVPFIIWR